MGFESKQSGIAASIFLSFYVIYLGVTVAVVVQKGIKSIYTMLLVFAIFRVVGQMSAVIFAKLGYEHYQWLIVYLVFSAEGYFVLVLASFRFLVLSQKRKFGTSWIRPSKEEVKKRVSEATGFRKKWNARQTLSANFHMCLIPANALVVSGGSILAGIDVNDLSKKQDLVTTSKALRTSGQAIFLAETVLTVCLLIYCVWKEHVRDHTVVLIAVASPFLLVRGIAGVLAIYIRQMNYYDMRNYTSEGLSLNFVTYEYTLTATMELIVGICLILNFYIEQYRTRKHTVPIFEQEEAPPAQTKTESSSGVSDS